MFLQLLFPHFISSVSCHISKAYYALAQNISVSCVIIQLLSLKRLANKLCVFWNIICAHGVSFKVFYQFMRVIYLLTKPGPKFGGLGLDICGVRFPSLKVGGKQSVLNKILFYSCSEAVRNGNLCTRNIFLHSGYIQHVVKRLLLLGLGYRLWHSYGPSPENILLPLWDDELLWQRDDHCTKV